MGGVIILSGPVGAGKTTVAKELVKMLPEPISYIEGDKFWSFIAKSDRNRNENFRVIIRAMLATARPFARSGYDVLVDFSIPPEVVNIAATKILKEVPLDYIVLLPSIKTCEGRAANRADGAINDYSQYRSFYELFEGVESNTIRNDEATVQQLTAQITHELNGGRFRIRPTARQVNAP
jgi:adenylylsulfate kinase-like enzyme